MKNNYEMNSNDQSVTQNQFEVLNSSNKQKKKMSKKTLVIIVLVAVVLLAGGVSTGVYFASLNGEKEVKTTVKAENYDDFKKAVRDWDNGVSDYINSLEYDYTGTAVEINASYTEQTTKLSEFNDETKVIYDKIEEYKSDLKISDDELKTIKKDIEDFNNKWGL